MNAINKLLDKAKQSRSLPTDMALADALHVGRAAVSGWRHGVRHPDPVACARIAEMAGEPLQRVLGIVGEARALSQEEKQVWRRLAQAAVFAFIAAGQLLNLPIMLIPRRWLNGLPRQVLMA